MRAIEQLFVVRPVQQRLQQSLPFDQWNTGQVVTLQVHDIEQYITQFGVGFARKCFLQQAEIASPLVIQRNQLAIEASRMQPQCSQCCADAGHTLVPVDLVARPKLHLALGDAGQESIAIPLDLM